MHIWQTVKQLFSDVAQAGDLSVRLVGVGVSGFSGNEVQQGDLFGQDTKQDTLDVLNDEINQRFGDAKIHRGRKL